jgi:hypothetical protein
MELMHLSPVAFLLLAIFWKMSRESHKNDEREKKRDERERGLRIGEHGPLGKRIV